MALSASVAAVSAEVGGLEQHGVEEVGPIWMVEEVLVGMGGVVPAGMLEVDLVEVDLRAADPGVVEVRSAEVTFQMGIVLYDQKNKPKRFPLCLHTYTAQFEHMKCISHNTLVQRVTLCSVEITKRTSQTQKGTTF